MKNIIITACQEGASGVDYVGQYNTLFSQEQMAKDINAAADVILAKGYEAIVFNLHSSGYKKITSKYTESLRREIRVVTARELGAYLKDCMGAALLGMPAKAGTNGAFMDGTYNPLGWHDYRLNGVTVSEGEIYAAYFGHFGIPVLIVSGCEKACEDIRARMQGVLTVRTKTAVCRNVADCVAQETVRENIRETLTRAIEERDRIKPYSVDFPLTVSVTYNRTDYCDDALRFHNYKLDRTGARVCEKKLEKLAVLTDLLL